MEIRVRIGRGIVVDNNVDALDIDATTEDVRSDENALLECLERGISLDTLLLL